MVTIYPNKVKHTTYDRVLSQGTASDDRGFGTQKLYNEKNMTNKNKTYASWGIDTTNLTLNRYHDSPYCIATPSGTRRQPEEIILTDWKNSLPSGSIVTKVKVEFAYYTERYVNMSEVPGYFPNDTVIKLMNKNGKKIDSDTAKGPTGENKQRSVTFSNLKIKASDLKDTQVSIQIGENKRWGTVCKVKIQYLRIEISYTDPTPKYQITNVSIPESERFNVKYQCKYEVNSTNSYSAKTTFYLQVPKGTVLSDKGNLSLDTSNKNANFDRYKQTIQNVNNKISFKASNSTTGKKTFYAYLSAYGNNTSTKSINIVKPEISFDLSPATANAINDNGEVIPINQISLSTQKNKTQSFMEGEKYVQFVITLNRNMNKLSNKTENVTITAKNFNIEWQSNSNVTIKNNVISFNNKSVTLKSKPYLFNEAKSYSLTAKYYDQETSTTKEQTCIVNVKGVPLKKEYFKLRLEDGSDVQYNSLSFSRGDDLKEPLTYEMEDITSIKAENFIIKGETKRISVGEAEYIDFDIILDTEEDYTLENVLAYIDVVNEYSDESNDIVVGIGNNGTLLDSGDKKYCLINKISNKETTKLRLVVLSEIEQDCVIKIKPYNYDLYGEKWTPSTAIFSYIPNVFIHIDSDKNDISSGDTITVNYYIENKSDIVGKNLKFQLIEPSSFEILTDIDSNPYENVFFNTQNRIITFNELEEHSGQYIFSVTYKATRKGIYNFILNTVDNENTVLDDQSKNSYKYQVLVDILSDVHIKTFVNKGQPYVNELIDFTIQLENRFKPQQELNFNISDVGDFTPLHNQEENYDGKDYIVEYVDCEFGDFTINNDEDNNIGYWSLSNVPTDSQHQLTLSLRPKKSGLHTIHTDFANSNDIANAKGIQRFDNRVKVLEAKKQIDFNVYQAVIDDDIECPNIEDLIVICDDDYINLTDDIYYIIEVKNNSVLELAQDINVYARLDKSFLENEITCYTPEYKPIIDFNSDLLTVPIKNIEGCSTIKFFFKVTPTEEGEFISNFMLATKTADVLNKQLKITIDSEFNQREIEHEINIYNFEKTNRNYRYEIDNNGEIFKFFNKGDRSVRPIETEQYNINLVETYKGNNLKNIVENIKDNSKYVDPIFLRIGSNKLTDRGYELYPDGFIRRFGLLKSEIFHYSNQLPVIENLGEKAFKWDVDEWDTKVWAGDPYDNGIFDVTIDYSKVPSNFDVLDTEYHPINRLQNIVNKTKPYGTKGICHYATTSRLKFKILIEEILTSVGNNIDLAIKFADMFLTTTLNRHDNSLGIFYDIIDLDFHISYETICGLASKDNFKIYTTTSDDYEKQTYNTKMETELDSICIYDDIDKRFYIEDCMDIVRNLYDINNNTKSVDITFPYQKFVEDDEPQYLFDYQFLNCINECVDNQFIGYEVNYQNVNAKIGYKREDINNFEGFVLEIDGEEINRRQNNEEVDKFSIGVYRVYEDNNMTIHFWGSINEKEYYHIGFIEFANATVSQTSNKKRMIKGASDKKDFFTVYNNMFNTHDDNNCQATHTAYKGDVGRTIEITFKITDQIKEQEYHPTHIKEIGSKKWAYLNNINKNHKYATFEYNSKVDKECSDKKMHVPTLAFKYDTNLNRQNEVVDIDFTIKAQTNKGTNDFINDLNINVLKDGDYIYPTETSRKIYYPESISNPTKDLLTTYVVNQPNITICTECLKTTLGYYDKCPYCNSQEVHHNHQTEPVTICESCGWVAKGTNKFCKHCLSLDVNNVDVDYNKTYCNDCKKIFDDYYRHCPNCFSSDTIYLDNKQQAYHLLSNQQNIDPITIKTNETDVNVFNINVPFNMYSDELAELESLTLNIYFTNNNDGKYYYCPDCNTGGLGHFSTCPKCNSRNIQNKNIEYNNFNTYIKTGSEICKADLSYKGETNNIISLASSVRSIDILSIAKETTSDSFDIQIYIVNPHVDLNVKNILDLPIDDEYLEPILNKLNSFDFTIDNLTVDCVFKNNNNWLNLESMEGENHTGLKYEIQPYESFTESLELFDFNIPSGRYDKAYLYLSGICKSPSKYSIIIYITDADNQSFTKKITDITDVLFNYEIDLIKIVGSNLQDLKIEIVFDNIDDVDEIIITDCNILTETETGSPKDKTMIDNDVVCIQNNNTYLLKSNRLWGLNESKPKFLSGRQLETNLLCYLDFGDLASSEYIRLYDIYMTIYYKTKIGKITTDTIQVMNNRNIEQCIDGQINSENGEIWGSIKETQEALNNLEYEKLNIDTEGKLSNSIPLYNKISQSFTYYDDNIAQIDLGYFGKKGYPSDIISIYLYDDYNDRPNNLIAQNNIIMTQSKDVINVNFDVDNIKQNKKYWIVIEDLNADDNNYHRFHYNNNEEIGTLIKDKTVTNKESLCFAVHCSKEKQSYHKLPVEWTVIPTITTQNDSDVESTETEYGPESEHEAFNDDAEIEYKMTNTFYRYNVKDSSNISLSNMVIKNGYYYEEEEEEVEEENEVNENASENED